MAGASPQGPTTLRFASGIWQKGRSLPASMAIRIGYGVLPSRKTDSVLHPPHEIQRFEFGRPKGVLNLPASQAMGTQDVALPSRRTADASHVLSTKPSASGMWPTVLRSPVSEAIARPCRALPSRQTAGASLPDLGI